MENKQTIIVDEELLNKLLEAPTPVCGETSLKDDSYNTSQVNYQLIELLNRVDSMSSFVEDLSHDIAL